MSYKQCPFCGEKNIQKGDDNHLIELVEEGVSKT